MVSRLKDLGVSFVKVDFSNREPEKWAELARTGSDALPVNLIYPPNYPVEPAIKLDTLVTPEDVHRVLDRMEEIVSLEKKKASN